MNIIVVGGKGKLGKSIVEKLTQENHNTICIDINAEVKKLENLTKNIQINAIIDVSCAENSINSVYYSIENKIPLIIGCTGHNLKENEIIKEASNKIPILLSYNFSLALQYFYDAINTISKAESKIYITETHHINKKDAPSGTAKEIKNIINKNKQDVEDIFSMRAGNIVGLHSVDFIFNNESIKLSHEVFSRKVFADGAYYALNFIVGKKKGLFSMKDIIKNAK